MKAKRSTVSYFQKTKPSGRIVNGPTSRESSISSSSASSQKDTGSTLTQTISLNSQDEAIKLFGRNGELRKQIQSKVPVRIVDRGTEVSVIGDGEQSRLVRELLDQLLIAIRNGHTPTSSDVSYAMEEAESRRATNLGAVLGDQPEALRADFAIKARTHGQHRYLEAIRAHDVVIVAGPAGTGKTYLAMAAAISALLNKEVDRLILTRPAVEAGESLGFLPGDLTEKVNPYLRPLFDALYSILDVTRVRKLFDREQIEIAPLAFMRGRTLSRCYAILDEAQNTTTEQMKMFLTRLGEGSRAIVTGDPTQVDLPPGTRSGLDDAREVLHDTEGIGIIELERSDIVRHPLVQNIVEAYEAAEDRRSKSSTKASRG